MLDLTKAFLERAGDLKVDLSPSSYQALDMLRLRPYDAVVSDYDMPEMDGVELLKQVRIQWQDLPFLLFTGKGREEVVIEALNSGADFYIQKGGDVKAQFVELEHKIRQAVMKRQAEYALSVSERHERFLVNIIKQSTQAFVVSYSDGGLGLPNNAFCVMTGYTEDEVKRINWLTDLTPFDWREVDDRAFHDLERTGVPQRYERELRRKDGTTLPVEVLVHQVKNDAGETQYYYSFINDISERRRAEKRINQTYSAMEASIDGIAILNEDGELDFVNQAFARIHGYDSPQELRGGMWLDLGEESERRRFEADIIPQVLSEGFWRGRSIGLRRDGKTFPQEVSVTVLEGGGFITVVRDVTEQERDKEALKRSQEELRSVFENALVGIYRTTPEGKILMANPTLIKILGYSSFEEMVSNSDANLLYVDENRTKLLKEIDRRGYMVGMEARWRRKDGSLITIRDSAKAVRDKEGRTLYYEGTLEDVTERRKAEQALQRANDKLNLLNSITRHDILNQLIVVQGYSELLRMKDNRKAFTDYMDRMDRAIQTIRRQIEFTRDYQNMGVKEPVWQNLHQQFLQIANTFDLHDIVLEAEDDGWEIFADPMFEKVFYNLIDNSLRHGGKVRKLFLESAQNGGELVITYGDDGVGISQKDKDRIFQMGYGKNTGLGLFLVRSILEFTQITIVENGVEGEGVRFIIAVPAENFRRAS